MLRELRDSLGHFSVVSEVEPEGVRVLATLPGKSSVEIGVKRGSLLSFHGSAQGKVALAFGDERARVGVPLAPRVAHAKTIVSPAILRRELDLVHKRGWAVAPNEALARRQRARRAGLRRQRGAGRDGEHRGLDPVHRRGTDERADRARQGRGEADLGLARSGLKPVLWLTRPPRTCIVPRMKQNVVLKTETRESAHESPHRLVCRHNADRSVAFGASAQDTFKIGSSVGLTGYAAVNDRAWRDSLLLAAEALNAKGGLLGKKVEVIVEDSDPSLGKPWSATRLTSTTRSTSSTAAAYRRCQRRRAPWFALGFR